MRQLLQQTWRLWAKTRFLFVFGYGTADRLQHQRTKSATFNDFYARHLA